MKRLYLTGIILSVIIWLSGCAQGYVLDATDSNHIMKQHVPLEEEKYYQYSFLNDVEKEVYRRIRTAALSYDRVIEVGDLDIGAHRKLQIVECVMVDNPQLFWVDGTVSLNHKGDICLRFCDGVVTDDSGFGEADLSKIDARRKTLDEVVFNIVSSINPADSQYEKELAIHDYITKTTSYDKEASRTPFVNGTMDSAYNIYGTLVEHKGVCSGYTGAFQYLCYMVGINSNVVFGNSHSWNTVNLDGEWYQVDVTWDDPAKSDGSSGDGNHNYFNMTSAQMYQVHQRSTDSYYDCIKVPECTATKYSYKNDVPKN